MGVRFATVASTAIVASPGAAAETIICTTPPINLFADNALVSIWWWFNMTLQATVSTVAFKLRRGPTTSDTQINRTAAFTWAGGSTCFYSGCYVDTPGVVAEQQYCITVTCNSAGGASLVNDVCLACMVL
ncbi:MAG: hypothetical protein LAN64_16620 [Acidobacteriia bacterium]|nr:hypothetical protein [Terriglobia bacterium]